jgi:hypothetical protein
MLYLNFSAAKALHVKGRPIEESLFIGKVKVEVAGL